VNYLWFPFDTTEAREESLQESAEINMTGILWGALCQRLKTSCSTLCHREKARTPSRRVPFIILSLPFFKRKVSGTKLPIVSANLKPHRQEGDVMRTLSAILFSSLIFSVALAQQEKQPAATPSPAKTAATNTETTPGDQKIETKANSLGLAVTRAIFARGIDENKQPVDPGTEFAGDGNRVYCITQIQGAKQPVTIEHRWYKDGVLVLSVELPIKSLNWRTQSYKTIQPTMAGNWKVDVVLIPGEEVLASLNFKVK
jgi:hypothetical protein